MSEEFDTLVDLLNSEPTQQCVVRADWLDDLGVDPDHTRQSLRAGSVYCV